jgi:hypothetical protein
MCSAIRSDCAALFQQTHFYRLQKTFIFAIRNSYQVYGIGMDRVLKGIIEIMNRLCIYPKDIQVITGRSDRYGRNLIKKIKDHFSKQHHQVVTVDEFCQYMGLQQEVVVKQLR